MGDNYILRCIRLKGHTVQNHKMQGVCLQGLTVDVLDGSRCSGDVGAWRQHAVRQQRLRGGGGPLLFREGWELTGLLNRLDPRMASLV